MRCRLCFLKQHTCLYEPHTLQVYVPWAEVNINQQSKLAMKSKPIWYLVSHQEVNKESSSNISWPLQISCPPYTHSLCLLGHQVCPWSRQTSPWSKQYIIFRWKAEITPKITRKIISHADCVGVAWMAQDKQAIFRLRDVFCKNNFCYPIFCFRLK